MKSLVRVLYEIFSQSVILITQVSVQYIASHYSSG